MMLLITLVLRSLTKHTVSSPAAIEVGGPVLSTENGHNNAPVITWMEKSVCFTIQNFETVKISRF